MKKKSKLIEPSKETKLTNLINIREREDAAILLQFAIDGDGNGDGNGDG